MESRLSPEHYPNQPLVDIYSFSKHSGRLCHLPSPGDAAVNETDKVPVCWGLMS